METTAHGITAPASIYEIGGQRFTLDAPGFADAIADAHASRLRPRCMCVVEGVEMYVARLAGPYGGYIVKRMPDTGSGHAPDCPSYAPPAELSGLRQVMGSAITEDPATGETTLKLDFTLTKMPGRSLMPPPSATSDSVTSDGSKLSLRGLLHYLWDQAELTRWHPGFAGKRSWATVRKHLLQAAEGKVARGQALAARLYVPEAFTVEHRDGINARRVAQWAQSIAEASMPRHLMLMIAEVKEIIPARYGFKAVIKHVPDQAFMLDGPLHRRLGRHFAAELALWAAAERVHLVLIATFGINTAGLPSIEELSLMPVSEEWLPVADSFELQLLARLVQQGRSFVKPLRYNLAAADSLPTAVLTDCADAAMPLFIEAGGRPRDGAARVWAWQTAMGAVPPFPPHRLQSHEPIATAAV